MSPEEWLASQTKQGAPAAPAMDVAIPADQMSPEQWLASQPKPKEMGFFESIGESITGRERATPVTQALPDWASMPELNTFSMASFKSALGTTLTNPQETVQVIKSNFPGVEVRQDEKGNFLLRSSIDGQEYAIKPGFQVSDIPRAAAGLAAFTPAGRAATIPGAVAAGAGTQAVIEATQAATGGQFNPMEVVTAGALQGAAPVAARAFEAVKPAAQRLLQRVTGATPESAPIAPAARVEPTMGQPAPVAGEVAEIEIRGVGQVPPVEPPIAPTSAEVGDLVRRASSGSFGSTKAQEELASMVKVNPAAKEAAERLGIDLPADVFSDNPQIRAAAGLTRSAAGSEAEAAWRTTVGNAVDQADDVIRQFDTTFVEGMPSPGVVSQKVRDSLTTTRSALNKTASKVYQDVDLAVPPQSVVSLPKLRETIDTIKTEVGEGGMSTQERKLMKLLDEGNVTYGRLKREKNLIGQAVSGKESPYGNLEAATLKRLYAALAEDQLTNVGNIGGEPLRQQLRAANLLYAKERALGKRIVNAFGQDIDGSIANLMRSAITSSAKGDAAQFSKLLKVVPEDLRKETIATALASVTRSTRGAERGAFGFDEFAKTYRGLRANAPVYSEIVKTLGKDADTVLRDLYEVSKRVTDARANVLTTGKANQAMVESLKAEGIVGKVMQSTLAKGALTGVAAMGGGPIAAGAASVITTALTSGNKDAVKAAGKLFASDEFQKMAIEAATKPEVNRITIKKVANSKAFKQFADAIKLEKNLTKREQWLIQSLQTERQFDQENQ